MLAPDALKLRIAAGIMAFPATPLDSAGALDLQGLESHVALLAQHAPTALVAAGGAGELFSLSQTEHSAVLRATVAAANGVPVIGGAGYGTATAVEMARDVERLGGDAVLLLPPYLVNSEQEGLYKHVAAVASAVSIAVIPYSRDNAVLSADTMLRLADTHPNIIGVKDGTGEIVTASEIKRRAGDRLVIVNGAPTAELYAPSFQSIAIESYSSAVFTFAPKLARAFFTALTTRDSVRIKTMLVEFYVPLVAIRDRKRGYAVSIVKAGLRIAGVSAGPVRPPLVDLDSEELELLTALIEHSQQWLA